MKRFLPTIIFVFALLWAASSWRSPRPAADEFSLKTLGKIPVLVGGRIKPLDTVARNSLLIIHGKETVRLTNGKMLSPMHWLAETLFNAPVADRYPVFVIQNPDVLGLFGWEQKDRKYFGYAELKPFLRQIEEQGALSEKLQSVERSAYQNAVLNLRNGLVLYQRLENSLQPEGATNWAAAIGSLASQAVSPEQVARQIQRNQQLAETAYILAVPPAPGQGNAWRSSGETILQSIGSTELHPVVKMYAQIGDAWRAGDRAGFNRPVALLFDWMAQRQATASSRASFEFLFNQVDPFMHSMVLYVTAFLLACGSWLLWPRILNRSAFYLLLLGLAIHTFGLVSRMYLQERPPVTNLYSSAIFIGWGAVIVALILERIFRGGIGAACAGAIGFITLIIAHHLAGSGDTLEMLRAVLDTNIWLATHVVAITTGYSAMFLAGMLAIIYIVRGVFTCSLTRPLADSLARMTYGVVCFATFFSFVGTVLGGIWADQSWGRFWGWDPKENGAVLIVLWCAMILHARWGGFIRQRGLMIMAVFGNVITSFSWFGVNMLGVGLHSYGFMEKAFPWLCGFVLSQLALMAVAALPLERWRSFRITVSAVRPKTSRPEIAFTSPELAIETK
jgi:ABC-type transport system involved in cytochrome c biogenesis permease subunit